MLEESEEVKRRRGGIEVGNEGGRVSAQR